MSPRTSTREHVAPVTDEERAYLERLHQAHCRVCAAPPATTLVDLPKVKVPGAEHYVAALVSRFAPTARPVPAGPLPKLLRAARGEGS